MILHWFDKHPCLLAVTAILALMAMCVLAYIAVPGESHWLPQCQFHQLTGLYCPGCGNTRALHALVHGNIIKSLRCNVLLVPMTVSVLCLMFSHNVRLRTWLGYVSGIVIVLFGILRNLPWQPFILLSPP